MVIHWIVNYQLESNIQLLERLGVRVFCRCANVFARINTMLKTIVVKVLGQGDGNGSLRTQLTFHDATTGFPTEKCLRNEHSVTIQIWVVLLIG